MSNIKIIIATDLNGGFGKGGRIPWRYTEDFAFFRSVTKGKPCIMGRRTYEEINELATAQGRKELLPGRTCYVLSNVLTHLDNAHIVRTVSEVTNIEDELFVIGGSTLYKDALQYASEVYLTTINNTFDCDVFFDVGYVRQYFYPAETYPSTHPDLTFTRFKRNETI